VRCAQPEEIAAWRTRSRWLYWRGGRSCRQTRRGRIEAAQCDRVEWPELLCRRHADGLRSLRYHLPTANGRHPADIGFALSVGTIAAIAGQVPASILVDAVPLKRLITAVGIVARGTAASSNRQCCRMPGPYREGRHLEISGRHGPRRYAPAPGTAKSQVPLHDCKRGPPAAAHKHGRGCGSMRHKPLRR
jgi:hypothetical protein